MSSEIEFGNGLPAYNLERLSVLYMEKCGPLRVAMKMMLKELGIRNIWETTNLKIAPEIVAEKFPDLIITDWAPNFNALNFVDRVRGEKKSVSRFTPIIINSAYSRVVHVKTARDHGISDYLVKPSSPVSLYKRICAHVISTRQFVECQTYFGPDRRFQSSEFDGDDRRGSN